MLINQGVINLEYGKGQIQQINTSIPYKTSNQAMSLEKIFHTTRHPSWKTGKYFNHSLKIGKKKKGGGDFRVK